MQNDNGFMYILAVYNIKHKQYEHVPYSRLWDWFINGFPTIETHNIQIAILPTRAFIRDRQTKKGYKLHAQRLQPWLLRWAEKSAPLTHDKDVLLSQDILTSPEAETIFVDRSKLKGSGYFAEEKFDGDRMQFHFSLTGNTYNFFTRNGFDWSDRYSIQADSIISTLKKRSTKSNKIDQITSIVLDGEMLVYNNEADNFAPWGDNSKVAKKQFADIPLDTVVMTHDSENERSGPIFGDGSTPRFLTFDMLLKAVTRQTDPHNASDNTEQNIPTDLDVLPLYDKNLVYMAFDILHLNGMDLIHLPLFARKRILHSIIPPKPPSSATLQTPTVHIVKHETELFNHLKTVLKKQGEGLVIKNPFSPYTPKRHPHWQKIKPHLPDVTAVIVGFGFHTGSKDLFSSGDSHLSGFTLALPQAPEKRDMLYTTCHVSSFRRNIKYTDTAKRLYIDHESTFTSSHLQQILNTQSSEAHNKFVLVHTVPNQYQAFVMHGPDPTSITIQWKPHPALTDPPKHLSVSVIYESTLQNIHYIAHPYIFPYSLSVTGDYRVISDRVRTTRPRFTSKYTIRFPVGVLRPKQDMHPYQSDTIDDMVSVQKQDPENTLSSNFTSAHYPLTISDPQSTISQTRKSNMARSFWAIRNSQINSFPNADIATVQALIASIQDTWPSRLPDKNKRRADLLDNYQSGNKELVDDWAYASANDGSDTDNDDIEDDTGSMTESPHTPGTMHAHQSQVTTNTNNISQDMAPPSLTTYFNHLRKKQNQASSNPILTLHAQLQDMDRLLQLLLKLKKRWLYAKAAGFALQLDEIPQVPKIKRLD
eukprot:148523-Rhodomonas_salina.1